MALNNTITTVGVPSSAGYLVYSGLIHPIYAESFIKRLYAETISGQITSQSVVPSELRQHGDLAIFRTAPRGQLHRYAKNQDLEVSTFNSETRTFKVDQAHYWNLKLDEVDVRQIKDLGMWIKLFQDDSMQQLAAIYDHDILETMVHSAHPCNAGDKAGIRSRSYNLGKIGVPLPLSASSTVNPLTLTAVMRAVAGEQNVPYKGLVMIWPQVCQPLFLATPVLANAYQSGAGKSSLISGEVTEVMGIKHFFSANAPTYIDPVTAEVTYPVILCNKEATGFVNQLSQTQMIKEDPRSFSQYWRGLQIAGWGVIRPELIVRAYVKVQSII